MTSTNYTYDEIGQLTSDADEGIINIDWKVTNKVKVITKADGTVIEFDYDAMGNRIAKKVYSGSGRITKTFYILDAQGNTMSIYKYNSSDDILTLSERNIYGSSRVGIKQVGQEMKYENFYLVPKPLPTFNYFALNYTGDKRYELSNHLGNVLTVVTDRKLPQPAPPAFPSGDILVDYYTADVVAFNDYYPFGMVMPGRNGGEDFRYGFQGQESDDEVKEQKGTSINYKYRMHDPRVGRFFAVDPLAPKYPHYTPYSFSGNKVIHAIELEGLEEVIVIQNTLSDGSVAIKVYRYSDVNFDVIKTAIFHAAVSASEENWSTNGWGKGALSYGETEGSNKNHWNGPPYGQLIIRSYADGSPTTYCFLKLNVGVLDAYEEAVNSTMTDGLKNIIVGGITIVGSVFTEVGSGGFASIMAYAAFIQGEDKLIGGFEQLFNPKDYLAGEDSQPIKALIGKYLNEKGVEMYEVIEFTTGVQQMTTSSGELVEIVGAYETVESALEQLEKYKEDE